MRKILKSILQKKKMRGAAKASRSCAHPQKCSLQWLCIVSELGHWLWSTTKQTFQTCCCPLRAPTPDSRLEKKSVSRLGPGVDNKAFFFDKNKKKHVRRLGPGIDNKAFFVHAMRDYERKLGCQAKQNSQKYHNHHKLLPYWLCLWNISLV